MHMDRDRRSSSNSNGVVSNGIQQYYDYDGDYSSSSASFICRKLDYDDLLDRGLRNRDNDNNNNNNNNNKAVMSLSLSSPSSSPPPPSLALGFIEHSISKFDTLAGVAIKYGVEVADIRKMNGLVTDRQMFALKSLQIPLPGRHPPSPCLSSNSDNPGYETPSGHVQTDLLDSFQSLRLKSPQPKFSSAMSSLRDYYGLRQADKDAISSAGGFEMAVYKKQNALHLDDGPFLKSSNPPLSRHHKSRSLASGILYEIADMVDKVLPTDIRELDSEKWNDKLVRRRQKSVADFTTCTSELLLDDNSGVNGFSAITGRGLALRNKAPSQTALAADGDSLAGDSSVVDNGFLSVRKSSSTSSLQEQECNNVSGWATAKWSLKTDLQALSTSAIGRPIFDALPKPITGRKNKAALD